LAAVIPPVYLQNDPNPNTQRYGLFNVATGPLEMEPHARMGGYVYQTDVCNLPFGYAVACTPAAKTFTDSLSTIVSTPFMVVASVLCGTIGHTPDEWAAIVMDRLKAGEQAAVERIFSDGLFGASPSLANNTPNATQLTAALDVASAIGALEDWLYSRYGPVGVLHIPMRLANRVMADYHVIKEGGVWKTQSGTLVSFGNYSGLKADGTAPAAGDLNIYITGEVTVWRDSDSEVFISPYGESIDKVTNQIRMFAERTYDVSYDCFAAAIEVPVEVS